MSFKSSRYGFNDVSHLLRLMELPSDLLTTDELIYIRNKQLYRDNLANLVTFIGVTDPVPSSDPYFDNVVLFLECKGTDGSQAIVDSSTVNTKIVTAVGDSKLKTNIFKYNSSSLFFDGNGDYLTVPHSTDFRFGSVNFTLELWIYPLQWNSENVFITKHNAGGSAGTNQFYFGQYSNKLVFGASIDGFTYTELLVSNTLPSLSQWHHIAVSRNSDTFRLFINGNVIDQVTNDLSFYDSETEVLGIGYRRNNGLQAQNNLNAYLSHIRVTKGIGRYVSQFNPETDTYLTGSSSSPPDPLRDSVTLFIKGQGIDGGTTFTDNSTYNHTVLRRGDIRTSTVQSKYNGSSIYFNGINQFLQVDSDLLTLGLGNFCIESWYMSTDPSKSLLMNNISDNQGNPIIPGYSYYSVGNISSRTRWYGTGSQYITSPNAAALDINQWHHIAAVRHDSVLKHFVNGVLIGTIDDPVILDRGIFTVGAFLFAGFVNYTQGYISHIRVTKGVPRYTSNFNPETDTYLNS